MKNGGMWAAIIIVHATLMFWNIYIGSNFANIIEVIGLCFCIYGLRKYFKAMDRCKEELKEFEKAIEKFKKDVNLDLMDTLKKE
ncbi:hypothetical protein SFC65_19000 [Priestia filamentosa]|uniref:hypothetical protein n=1 Tax=Priestia filamentosa TaxID=1402861 RepID=UPI0039825EDB